MARLTWAPGSYRDGVDRGVLFLPDGSAEAWNGLSKVAQTPTDQSQIITYRDGIKLANRRSEDSFSATVEAFTYPDSLVTRTKFGFSYRVMTEAGYRTHLVYNAMFSPPQHNYQVDDVSPFGFDISTTPVPIPGCKPSAHLVITEHAYSWTIEAFEEVLYGTDANNARLPMPEEVLTIFGDNALLQIVDNGDGTWTATGPPDAIQMLDDTTFQITWPSAVMIDEDTYTIYSL